MPTTSTPSFELFFDVLQTLEDIGAPYMIIGAFAAMIYGTTRVTYDVDIIVDLADEHIQALAAAYPLPRYYADPEQMRSATRDGTMFNIIDSTRGEKADLIPLTMNSAYRQAFARRVRQTFRFPPIGTFTVWCARADDVVVGKLMAWKEGRSTKHRSDILELLISYYLDADALVAATFDWAYTDRRARALGDDVAAFWHHLDQAARQRAAREAAP
ncbi:MAG: hypothetical protein M5U01_07980 [Ardenticatenaceae bacterium]|nr:hypothetical protein [Ardenticatenaceae bacterium]HBY96583.1 hypothetical protein [Chloroflexota bacterium]